MTHPRGDSFYNRRLEQIREAREIGAPPVSHVTDIVVHYGSSNEDMTEHLTEPQEFMNFTNLEQIDYHHAGGIKAFQGDMYAGAFNYLNLDALADWFLHLPWPKDAHAVMSVSVENEDFGLMVIDRGQAEWSVHPYKSEEGEVKGRIN